MSEDMSQLFNTFKNVLQAKSTSNESNTNTNTENSNSELNITPEMISMLTKKLQEQTNSNKNSHNSSNSSDTSSSSLDFSSQIDFETILKLKSIMEKFNKKDDPRTNLLHSLKPYLRESRQKKIDEYANLLKLASISDIFKNK